jgi:hypothetical protein
MKTMLQYVVIFDVFDAGINAVCTKGLRATNIYETNHKIVAYILVCI